MSLYLTTHATLAFFALSIAIISLWIKQSPWIWGSFLIFAFTLGFLAKLLDPIALAPTAGLLVLHSLLKGDIKGFARFVLFVITFVVSLGMLMHFFPGFRGVPIIKKTYISKGAYPFSLYLTFNKPLIGFFVLALGFPLVKNIRELKKVLKVAIPLTIGGMSILIIFALFSGLIRWDPKLPKIFWFFLIENLIFVCIIEEAFWRGFVQNELFYWFGGKKFLANTGSVLITAAIFAGLHFKWVPFGPFMLLIFVAGIIYGSIYQYTKSLEASIFCHWVFNITHFTLFTYPTLVVS